MHQIAEYILTSNSPEFAQCFPDRSVHLEQGNAE